MDELVLRFVDMESEYRPDGSSHVTAVFSMSGEIDGSAVPEDATRMRMELSGRWSLQGQVLTQVTDQASITPLTDTPELREFAQMMEMFYEQFPPIASDIESWDGRQLRVREQTSGEVFEMTRVAQSPGGDLASLRRR